MFDLYDISIICNEILQINDNEINLVLNLFDIDGYLELFLNYNISYYKNNIADLNEKYIRAKADIENLKKRFNEDISRTYKYAIEDFSENLLVVLDSLESALLDKSNNIEKLLEGSRLTLKLLTNILEKNNIKFILPNINDVFDPYKHLAISTVNTNNDNNVIFDILQKGYTISDRILRPALVVVNKV